MSPLIARRRALFKPEQTSSPANIQLVNQTAGGDTAVGNNPVSSGVLTLSQTPTTGNVLVLCLGITAQGSVASVASTGVTWYLYASESSVTVSACSEIWVGVVGSSPGTAVTITFTGNQFWAANCSEWSGVSTTNIIDVDNKSAVTSATSTISYASLTTTNAADLVIVNATPSAQFTPSGTLSSGFTALTFSADTSFFASVIPAYNIASSTGTYAPTYSGQPFSETWVTTSVALLASGDSSSATYTSSAPSKLIIPAYFDPQATTYWTDAISDSSGIKPGIMIANPNSGPGSSQQAKYNTAIGNAQTAGVKVIGYVKTGGGVAGYSPTNQIEPLVDDWFNWYSVDGIFFDECSTSPSELSYYTTLINYVKTTYGSTKIVALNPGSVPDEGYMQIGADIVMIEETTLSNWVNYTSPSWINNYPPNNLGMITYEVTSGSTMLSQLALIASYGVQWVYVTDDGTDGNPYDTLPGIVTSNNTYYDNELTTTAAALPKGGRA